MAIETAFLPTVLIHSLDSRTYVLFDTPFFQPDFYAMDVLFRNMPDVERISCERIDGLGSYFAYILLLIIPSLGFCQFSAELLALINGQK